MGISKPDDEGVLSELGLLVADSSETSPEKDESADATLEASKMRRNMLAAVIFSLVGAAGVLHHRSSSRMHSVQGRENAAAEDGFVQRYVPVGSLPWCPSNLQMQNGCMEKGHLDNDCCAFSGDGGCQDGSPVTEGKVCHENGAVATCCPPHAGAAAVTSAAAQQPVASGETAPAPAPNPAANPAPAPAPAQIGGLYCWMVSANWGGEAAITKDAFAKKRGAFACDEWSIFSNDAMPPVPTTKIGPLNSGHADWGSYLNTAVFLRAWDSVIGQNKWSHHAWTVKADPDTVWLPQRLHWYVDKLDAHSPIYLRNSGPAYLGPLEVFSFGAVQQFANRHGQVCVWGVDVSGEDGWMEDCMKKLGAKGNVVPNLLSSNKDPGTCGNGAMVAFHPFKDTGSYGACFGTATR